LYTVPKGIVNDFDRHPKEDTAEDADEKGK
jgi:hypothetical protein